jgi:peptidoglycan/LPS O-acetylase OafA/YrhL
MFVFREIGAPLDKTHESFPLFDWLRFALASVVALNHEQVIGWSHAGNLAVQVFFALSGWLIGGILARSTQHDLPHFYFNRATRIWIPYFIAVAVLYGLAAYRDGLQYNFLPCLFYDSTFTHNWFVNTTLPMPLKGTGNHFWSIAVEEQFYLAAPILIVLMPFGRSKLFWVLVAALAVLSGFWYGSISLGVLAAVSRPKFKSWQLVAALIAVSIAMLAVSYVAFAPFFAIAVVLLVSEQGPRSPVGEFLGGVSYPLYLYHWLGIFVANLFLKHSPAVGLVAYLVAVAVGVVAYLAVDRNVMRWRKRFYRPTVGKILIGVAYALLATGVAYGLTA